MSIFKSIFGSEEESSSSSTTRRELEPPSPAELQLLDSQVQLAQRQLESLSQLGTFTSDVLYSFLPQLQQAGGRFTGRMNALTDRQLDFSGQAIGAQDDLLRSELAAIERGVELTPEQDTLISEAANRAIELGLSDIGNFRDESLRQLAQETAPARGLRPNDTPILDVGGRIVNEAQRSASDLVSGVRGQEAQARLEFPIQSGQFIAGRTQAQQALTGGVAQFQEQLRQEAFNNRLRLTALTGQVGATNAAFSASPSTLAGLQQLRLGAATTTQQGQSQTSTLDPMSSIGAAGGFMSGLGAMGVAFSDRDAKTDIREVGSIRGIPLYKFKYKGSDRDHVGVMADEVPVEYVIHNPGGYDMVKYGELLHDL